MGSVHWLTGWRILAREKQFSAGACGKLGVRSATASERSSGAHPRLHTAGIRWHSRRLSLACEWKLSPPRVFCQMRKDRTNRPLKAIRQNGRIKIVQRRVCQIAVLFLLATYLCAPAFERIDHWDHFPQSGNDIVHNVVGFAVCLGAVAALSHLLCGIIGKLRKESALQTATLSEEFSLSAYSRPFLGASPPTLRI